jgi:hypothetical protein
MSPEIAETVFWWANWVLVEALVVGVLATYAIVVSGNVKDAALKRELSYGRTETARANEAAAASGAVADAARRDAAKANERAEELKAANLTLELIIAPRSLSPEQQGALASALKPFSGMKVIVSSPPMDGEALGIAQQILRALEIAGISPINMIGVTGHVRGFAFGIHMVGREGDKRNEALLKALYGTLASFGLVVDASHDNAAVPLMTYPGRDFPDAGSAAAAVFVGTKPVPVTKK